MVMTGIMGFVHAYYVLTCGTATVGGLRRAKIHGARASTRWRSRASR